MPVEDSGVAFFISIDEQLKLNRGCYFAYTSYASLRHSLSQYN